MSKATPKLIDLKELDAGVRAVAVEQYEGNISLTLRELIRKQLGKTWELSLDNNSKYGTNSARILIDFRELAVEVKDVADQLYSGNFSCAVREITRNQLSLLGKI